MKFFHIADVHLGAMPDKGFPWSYDRGREIWESFQNVIRQAGRENAGLFLIAGDLFHRQPLLKELKEVNALFASIPNTKIVLIAGNHDCIKENSFYKKISWAKNVFWLSKVELSYVDFPDLGVRVYGFSYHSREISEPRYDRMKISSSMPVNILLAHGGDESHIPISGDTFLCTSFDYVALGHIHKPQVLEKNKVAYAGSLEPLDKNETGPHGYIKGEIRKKEIYTEFVPASIREYRTISIQVERDTTQFSLENVIREEMKKQGEEHLYTILLEGRKPAHTEFFTDAFYKLGNIRNVEDRTTMAYSKEQLKESYKGSIMEAYLALFEQEETTEQVEKAFQYGVEALLESGEELP